MSDVLLVEAGNTHWQLASWEAGQARFISRGQTFPQLCEQVVAAAPAALAFASVRAPALTRDFVHWAEQQGIPLYWAQPTHSGDIQLCYDDPTTLGVDRWLTLYAAAQEQLPALIIDAGTAITADFLATERNHLGGWIAPGFQTMVDSLLQKSERLRVAAEEPATALGQSTEDALYLGCTHAQQGFLTAALAAAKNVFGTDSFALYLTGGGADYLQVPPYVKARYRPQLVLDGLAAWFSQHQALNPTGF